ncbi:kinesin-like protein KIF20B [Arapaima gigas]
MGVEDGKVSSVNMMESCLNLKTNSVESVVVDDLKKDLFGDFSAVTSNTSQDSSVLLEKEHLQVYLRIRPFTPAEIEHGESQGCVEIEAPDTVLLKAPRTSLSARLSDKSIPQTGQRFQFSQVYGPETTQKEMFDGTVKSFVKDVFEGGNSVVFTYGITNAGKTFTFIGPDGDGGILPRALNVIFNSIEDRIYTQMNIKPHRCRDYIRLTKDQQDEEATNKRNIMRLFKESDSQKSMSSQMSSSKSTLEGKNSVAFLLANDERFSLDVDCHTKFSVWVSFCEIYNENIHDLLEPVSNGTLKRSTLRLSQDVKGNSFVKDLKWIQVNDAEEAFKVLKFGKRNQSFSSTKLNNLSSRSHCIFSIRVIRIEEVGIPRVHSVSELCLCDLAGSERCAKTHNKGDRLKEAGNINTSLLILGKCINALRHNQQSKLLQHVPFRESKLTHYLQGFFCGRGKTCMIVNINQCASMFDETLNVLKFSAVAQKVVVLSSKPLPVIPKKSVREVSFIINNADRKNLWAKRKSSLVAWETSLEDVQENEGAEEEEETEDDENSMEESCFESMMEETIQEVDEENIDRESYNKLILLTTELKEKLHKEEAEKLSIESRIREEVTKEFMELFSKMESDYSERLLREKEIVEERAEKRMEIWKNLVSKNVESEAGMDFLEMINLMQDDVGKIKEHATAAQTCLSDLPDPHETISSLEKRLADLSEELSKNQQLLDLKNHKIEIMCRQTQQSNEELEEIKKNLQSKTQKFQELMEICLEKDDMISKLQTALDVQVETATNDRHLVESIKEEILQLKQNCKCLNQCGESTHKEGRKRTGDDEDIDGQPPCKKEMLKESHFMTDAEKNDCQTEFTQEVELTLLRQKYERLQQQLESAKADFQRALVLKDKEMGDLKQEQITMEMKVCKLLEDLKEQTCAHEAAVTSLDMERKEAERLVDEKETILQEKSKWQQDANNMAKKIKDLEYDLQEEKKKFEKASGDLKAVEALLVEHKDNASQNSLMIESLKQENEYLKKELKKSQILSEQANCSHFRSTMDSLRQECEKMVKESAQKSQQVQDLEQEVDRLQKFLTEQEELSCNLRSELTNLKEKSQTDLDHLEAEKNAAAQFKRKYLELEAEVALLKNQISDLEQQLSVSHISASKAAELEKQLVEKATQMATLQACLNEAQERLKDMETASVQEARHKETERRRELLKVAEEAISEKNAELDRKAQEILRQVVFKSSDKIRSLGVDLQRKEDDAADFKEKLVDSKKQIQQVQKEIESMREEERTLRRKLNELEKMKSQLLINLNTKDQTIQELKNKQDSCANSDENLERYKKACSDLQVKDQVIENMRLALMEQEETQEEQDRVLEAKMEEIKSLHEELHKLKTKVLQQSMGECTVSSDREECRSSQCERRLQEMNETAEKMKLSDKKYQADRKKWLDEKLILINQAKAAEERRNRDMRKFADDRERYAKIQVEMKDLSKQLAEKEEELKNWRKERDILVAALDVQIKKLAASNAEKDQKIEALSRNNSTLPQEVINIEELQYNLSKKDSEIKNLKQQLSLMKCKISKVSKNNELEEQTDGADQSETTGDITFKKPQDSRNKLRSGEGSRRTSAEKEPSVLDSSEISTEDGQATSRFPKPELEIQFTPLQPNKVNIKRQGGDSPVTFKITRTAKKRKSSEIDKDPVESENRKNCRRTANSRTSEDCKKSAPRYSRTAGRLRQEDPQSSVKTKKDGTLQKIGDFLQSSPTYLGSKAKKIMELVNSKSPETEYNSGNVLKTKKSKRKLYKTEISSPLDIPSHPIIGLEEDKESDHLIIKRRLRTRTAKK